MAGRIKGITVEINGDTTKLSKALQSVDKNIKNTQTQLKDVEKLLKLDPTNTELLAQKQKLLGQAVQDTKTRLDTLKKASEQAAKTKDNYDAWKAKYDPLKQKIGETETKLKDLKEQAKNADEQLAKGEISQEKYDALQREIKETTDELSGLKQQAKDVSDEFGNPISHEQYDALQREILETEHELQNLQTEASKSHEALVKIGQAGEAFEKVGGKIAGVGQDLTKYVTLPILGLGTAAVKTTADFDASMSKVAAVSGATGADFDALRAKAREMGSQTKFSASEAAEAMNYMSMAGWKTEDMLNGVEGIMNLAAASGEDLATTSDIVTDALTALGMTAGDSAHFADILAAASSNANTNVALMGESFKYVAPVAGAMGASAEDLSIALGLMANSGIKGSQAGNSLKNALVNLTKPTKQQAAAMQQLGFISTETIQKIDFGKVEKAEHAVEDATISLDNAQIKLNDAISKYGEGSSQAQIASNNYEKAQLKLARAQETLAKEQEGVSKEIMGANTLMTDADGNMRSLGDIMGTLREKMGKVNVELTDAEGNARDFDDIVAELSTTTEGLAQAEQMQAAAAIFGKQNMSGMLAIINASEEDYNKLTDAIYGCEGSAKGMAETMQDNLAGQITILKSQLQELAISFGDILMPAIRAIVSKIQAFVDKLNAMNPAVKETIVKVALVAAALGPLLVVIGKTMIGVGKLMQLISNLPTIIAGAKSAFAAFSGVIGGISAPVIAVIAVIAALVAAFVHLWKTNEDFRNKITAIWNQIKSIFEGFCQGIVDRVNALGFDFKNIGEVIKAVWDGLCKFLKPIFEGTFQQIANIFKAVTDIILNLLDVFIGIFTGDWDKVWNGIKGIFEAVWNFLKDTLKNYMNVLCNIFGTDLETVKQFWIDVWTAIKDFFVGIWNSIKNFFTSVVNGIATFFTNIWTGIKNFFVGIWTAIYSSVSEKINLIKAVIEFVWNAIHTAITTVMNTIWSVITTVWQTILLFIFNTIIIHQYHRKNKGVHTMFFKLILENSAGDRIDMTATANQYMTSKIEGLSPPHGTISTSSYAGMDGSYLNNAFIEKRNVVISFEMRGVGVEKRRHQLYKVVKPSRFIKVYYKTAGIDVFTTGYVETCEVQNFEMLTTGQISILCPDIYWYSIESVMAYYSQIAGAFTFPFPTESNPEPFILGKYNTQNIMEIINDGDETGFTLEIEALEDVRSPTLYNADTDEYLQITGDLQAGDIVTITTKTGNKTVTLDRGGIKSNIINRLVSGSTWLTLREGKNRFYLRGTGLTKLRVKIIHTNAYLGV